MLGVDHIQCALSKALAVIYAEIYIGLSVLIPGTLESLYVHEQSPNKISVIAKLSHWNACGKQLVYF